MTDAPEASTGRFLGVAVTRYDDSAFQCLDDARAAMRELRDVLQASDFHGDVLEDPTYEDIVNALDPTPVKSAGFRGPLLVAWTGHGKAVDNEFVLMAKNSTAGAMTGFTQRATELARFAKAAGSLDTLLIVDTCSSGAADAELVVQAIDRENTSTAATQRPHFAVLISCKSYDTAVAGAYLGALAKLLREGPTAEEADNFRVCWTSTNERVPFAAVNFVMANRKVGNREPRGWNSGGSRISFRNPTFDPTARTSLVATRLGDGVATEAEVVITPAMEELTDRASDVSPGLWLIVARAGAGKTTCIEEVADRLDSPVVYARDGIDELRRVASQTGNAPLFVDALDESPVRDLDSILDVVLVASSARFVAVTSRPDALDRLTPSTGGGIMRAERVVDLSDNQRTIAEYVARRLREAA